jgi:DNA-binding NarL/FixJ family response regulator
MLTRKLSLMVVDDHAIVREGLKRIVNAEEDFNVVAEATSVAEALATLRTRTFDLLLLDISLKERSGLELLKIVKQEWPRLPVLILSAYSEDLYAVRALRDGADGYLNKESAPELLVTAIRKVAAGGKYLTPALAERIAVEIGGKGDKAPHELLSDREFEILKMVATGQSLKQIAEKLHISPKTVTTYRSRIVEKTGLQSNAEMTRYALENNLLQ